MHKFVRSFITEWRRLGLPFKDEAIVVAVSGGADSMSLLLAIHELVNRRKFDLRVIVAHFNHKLRGRESDADEAFVRKCAAQRGLELAAGESTLKRNGNLEQNARDERYRFLLDTAREFEASIVLTAHSKNDQAETFLLNLIRGSGADGLGGMSVARKIEDDVLLVRPLLSWATRADTENYCREHDLEYRTDRMNDDEAFTRVRIRKTILPILAEINPRIVDTLAQTAGLLREQTASAAVPQDARQNSLELRTLKSLGKGDLYSAIRVWLRSTRGDLRSLQLKHIESIEQLITSPKSGKTVELPGGGRVVKGGGRLTFSRS